MDYRLFDTPLNYMPAYGPPISLNLAYQTWRPTDFGYYPRNDANPLFGPQWHCVWSSELAINDYTEFGYRTYWNYLGGRQIYSFNTDPSLSDPHYNDGSRVEIVLDGGNNVIGGRVYRNDGAVLEYLRAYSATRFFLTGLTDPQGKSLTFSYDGFGRMSAITTATGQTASFTYGDPSDSRVVTQVNAPGGYSATFAYETHNDGDPTTVDRYLTNITDTAGITSTFTYRQDVTVVAGNNATNWSLATLNTPYGTTHFDYLGSLVDVYGDGYALIKMTGYGVGLLITEPNGGQHLYVSSDHAPNAPPVPASFDAAVIPSGLPLNTLDTDRTSRNSFYWGPLQLASIGNVNVESWDWDEFKRARIRHWLMQNDQWDSGHAHFSDTLSWEQSPSPDGVSEGQVTFYDYAGKHPDSPASIGTGTELPAVIARVLPDGTTTWYQYYEHNAFGKTTLLVETYTQPDGSVGTRNNLFEYPNGVDMTRHLGPQGEQVVSNRFNAIHQVTNSFNALNELTEFTYNANAQLTSVRRPSGLITTNIYFASGNAIGRLDKTIDLQINRENSYTYYDNGLGYTHTDERGLNVTNYWDGLQRLTGIKYPDGTTDSNIYTALDITATKDRLGYWSYFGYNGIRQKIAETNANNVITRYGYCNCGALLYITNAFGTSLQEVTSFAYDYQGNRTIVYYPDGTIATNWYDPLRRLIATADGIGTRWFGYNNQGLLNVITNAAGIESLTVFDIEDRVYTGTDANGVTITNTYDNLGRLRTRTYPDTGSEKFGYSALGLVQYTNQLNLVTSYGYDTALRKTFETNANNEVIKYTYNGASDLLSLVDGKSQTNKWNYDEYGRVTNKLDQANVEILRYKYDANSRLTNRWSKAMQNTGYLYDTVGNLTKVDYPGGSTLDLTYAYDALNRLTNEVTTGVFTNKYSYYPGGLLATEDGPWASDTLTYTYNNTLRASLSLQQPTGIWTNGYTWDAAHRLRTVSSPAGTFTNNYVGAGKMIRKLALPNTSYITNTYDTVARLTGTYLDNSSNTVLDKSEYLYNTNSRRIRLTRTDGSYYTNTYDNIGQLKWADSTVASEDRGYLYDAAWNLNKRTNNGATSTFTVDNKNELTGVDSTFYSYDDNGNLTYNSTAGWTYYYDAENHLQAVDDYSTSYSFRIAFSYDGRGRLRWRGESVPDGIGGWTLTSETRYIYDGMRVIQERDGSNNPKVGYTRGNDLSGSFGGAGGIGGLLARSDGLSSGSLTNHNFYHADGNGNITYMLNTNQSMVASYRYDPFGSTISQSGSLSSANVYRFSSKELIGSLGLYYYGYRFYDPNLQRWLNRDPIADQGADLRLTLRYTRYIRSVRLNAQPNLYGFVGNSPIAKIDPLGNEIWVCPDLSLKLSLPYQVPFNPNDPGHKKAFKECVDSVLDFEEWLEELGMPPLTPEEAQDMFNECMRKKGITYPRSA